jgi:hypothetical protein
MSNHIEDICTKANKTLGLIKRVCARDVVGANTRKLPYCAVVRPKLESCVWSPYSAKQRKLIENVQRNEIHSELPSSWCYLQRQTNILKLSPSWTQAWTLWPNTIIQNYLINVTFNQYLTPATNPYATHNFDPNNYNIIVSNNQEFFRQSYFPRTVILWNNLPPNIKAAHSLQIFKHRLHSYYKAKLSTYIPP